MYSPQWIRPLAEQALPTSSADQPVRMQALPKVPFPEFCARFHWLDQGAAWIHKSWQSPQARLCCSVRCPMLRQNERARLWYRHDRAIGCLLAAADPHATEKERGRPPPAKSQAAPQLEQRLARPAARASQAWQLAVRRLGEPERVKRR